MNYDSSYLALREDGIIDRAWKDGFTDYSKNHSGIRYVATKIGDVAGINGKGRLWTFESSV